MTWNGAWPLLLMLVMATGAAEVHSAQPTDYDLSGKASELGLASASDGEDVGDRAFRARIWLFEAFGGTCVRVIDVHSNERGAALIQTPGPFSQGIDAVETEIRPELWSLMHGTLGLRSRDGHLYDSRVQDGAHWRMETWDPWLGYKVWALDNPEQIQSIDAQLFLRCVSLIDQTLE